MIQLIKLTNRYVQYRARLQKSLNTFICYVDKLLVLSATVIVSGFLEGYLRYRLYTKLFGL